jgi:hypothetical protein
MKEKILAELKKKYTGQLTMKFMESLAERLAVTITDEKDIEGEISKLDGLAIKITDIQAEGDRRAGELQTKLKELQDELKVLKEKPKPEIKDDNVKSEIDAIKSELENFRKFNKQQQARALFIERAKEKKIPKLLYDGIEIDELEKVDEVVKSLEDKSNELRQEILNEKLKGEPSPQGNGVVSSTATQVIDDIKNFKIKKEST